MSKHTSYYENGEISSDDRNKWGRNGKWTYYYENGQIEEEVNYKDDKKEGKWTSYYENGQIEEEVNYKDGIEDGKYVEYHENGQIKSLGNYTDGKEDGKWIFYHRNGQIGGERNHFNKRLTFKVKELLQIVDNNRLAHQINITVGKKYIKIKNNLINNGWDNKLGFDFSLDISIGSNGLPKKAIIRNGNHRLAIMKKYGLNYNIPTHLSLFYNGDKHLSEKYNEKYPSKKELLGSIKKNMGET